jgi:hypothetical protein
MACTIAFMIKKNLTDSTKMVKNYEGVHMRVYTVF